jgi:hypothetical protein
MLHPIGLKETAFLKKYSIGASFIEEVVQHEVAV